MYKIFTSLIIVALLFLQNQNICSQGTITKITQINGTKITVKGFASKELWLGCTINPDTYDEENLAPIKIPKGSFTEQFNLSKGIPINLRQGTTSIPFVIALWVVRINLRECENKYGKGSDHCKWARKEGYQLEGRVYRKTGEIDIGF